MNGYVIWSLRYRYQACLPRFTQIHWHREPRRLRSSPGPALPISSIISRLCPPDGACPHISPVSSADHRCRTAGSMRPGLEGSTSGGRKQNSLSSFPAAARSDFRRLQQKLLSVSPSCQRRPDRRPVACGTRHACARPTGSADAPGRLPSHGARFTIKPYSARYGASAAVSSPGRSSLERSFAPQTSSTGISSFPWPRNTGFRHREPL